MNPTDPPDVTPGKRGRTAVNPPDSKTAFSLSETEWRALIIASTALVILFSVYCLSNGITTIFMHLYYFPIVLLAYRYRMKGAVLAALLAVAYVVLVVIYDYGQTDVITGAFYRFIVFVAIAAVVGFLSEQLFRVQRSLKESSDVHERYISLAPAIILVLDTNGTIMHLNTFGCSILGCSVLEAEGKPWIDTFIREEERDTIHQIFESILRGDIETYRETEHEVITLDGVPRIIMWHNTVLTDDAGKITGVLSYGEDITGRKRDEVTIHALQQFQEGIITNANVWIMVLTPKGKILVWNNAAEAISGYTGEETLGTTGIWKRLYPDPAYRKWVTGEIARVITRDTYLEDFETGIRCRDGTKKTIAWNTKGLRNAGGSVENYIAVGRDVTERRKAEDEIARSEEKYRTLVEQISDVVYSLDGRGVITYISPAIEKITGYSPSEITGRDFRQFIYRDDLLLVKEIFENGKNNRVKSFQFRIVDRAGEVRWLRVSSKPSIENGKFLGINGVMLDITEQKRMEEDLRKSNEMNISLFAVIPDIIFILSEKGEFIDYRGGSKAGLYTPPDQFLGRTIDELLPPDVASLAHRKMQEVLATGTISTFEYSLDMGEIRHYHARMTRFGQDQFFCIIQDMTERKQMEEALRRSEEKYRAYIENALEGIFISDKTGRYLDVNPSACRLTGYTREEMLNLTIADLSGREADTNGFKTLLTDGRVVREILLKRKDGTLVPVILNAVMLPDGNLIGFCTDITERKQIEEALRKSEEKYRAYIENAVEGIFIADKSGRYIDVNPSACRLVGYTRDELLSLTIADLSAPDVLATANAAFQEILKKGRMALEIPLKRKDGTLVPVILNAVMLPDGNVMGFCTDITRRKMTEDALALASRKLNLLSSITRHDILNQLMVLIGYLDMALEDVTDPEQRQFIEVEMLAAKTIQRQIEFTREYQELGMQAPVWMNINQSLRQATFNLPVRDVAVFIDRNDLEVYADKLFEKVFYNLIDNALRYGGDGMTSISVSSHEEEKGLVIIFEDNGAGISAEDKQKLFTRGFGKNTGLGLFLSREILAITGITIDETGEPGKGARFEITVPKGMYRFTGGNPEGASP